MPITNHSSEGIYLEFGDEIGEVDLVEHGEILQVGDDGAQAAVDTLTLEQKNGSGVVPNGSHVSAQSPKGN